MTKYAARRTTFPNKLEAQEIDIPALNQIFHPLSPGARIRLLYDFFQVKDVLTTSSFGTHSAYLLYLISQIQAEQIVHFIDTGYLFEETKTFKNGLEQRLQIKVETIYPDSQQHEQSKLNLDWITEPKKCCYINKVATLEPLIARHKIWMSGLMSWQTDHRAGLDIFELNGSIIKFHPLIDIDEGAHLYHLGFHNLPEHPLKKFGYNSVGCTHCTHKGTGRSGRWADSEKSECGLHLGLLDKKDGE